MPDAPQTPKNIVFLVVSSLAVIAISGLAACVLLVMNDKDSAGVAIVSGLAGTALGGLLTVLANTRSSPSEPASVKTETTVRTVEETPPAAEIGGTIPAGGVKD